MGGWVDTKIKLLTERYIKCKDILHEYRAGKKIKVLSERGKEGEGLGDKELYQLKCPQTAGVLDSLVIFADLYLGCMVAFLHCTEPVWTLDRNWSGEV